MIQNLENKFSNKNLSFENARVSPTFQISFHFTNERYL